jgi:hypothetical protein
MKPEMTSDTVLCAKTQTAFVVSFVSNNKYESRIFADKQNKRSIMTQEQLKELKAGVAALGGYL